MKKNLVLICLMLAWVSAGHAGEALVAKVRGSRIVVDAGAEAGLMVGMEVTVVRPPGETIIHPITHEKLGAPEVEIGKGVVTKTSARAASIRLEGDLLMAVRPGDVVRFVTPEEEMIREQERTVAREEQNRKEHQEFRKNIAGLMRGIRQIQGRISSLDKMVKRVERVQEGFKIQLRGINEDINQMKEDIRNLKEQVALYPPPEVGGVGEAPKAGEPSLSEEDVRRIVEEAVKNLRPPAPAPPDTGEEIVPLPPVEEDVALAEEEAAPPFYTRPWFFGIVGGIGILAIAAFAYLRLTSGGGEDEEEEDEEVEEDEEEEDMDIEVEEEEEDDIVVEETS